MRLLTLVLLLLIVRVSLATNVPDTTTARLTVEFPEKVSHPAWVSIPYRKIGNLILIEAEIDTLRGNFILDTGAPHLVLNRTYFREYANEEYAMNGGGITGGASSTGRATVEGLVLQGITYALQTADVIPLGHLESSRKVKILGLLGNAVFAGKEIVIDDQHEVLHLFQLNNRGERSFAEGLPVWQTLESLPLLIQENILMVQTRIAGQKLRFCVDTGAESTVLHNKLPGNGLNQVTITGRKMLRGTGNKPAEVLEGTLNLLKVGEGQQENVPVIVTNLSEMSERFGMRIDGMLGYPYFANRVIGINFVTGHMSVLSS